MQWCSAAHNRRLQQNRLLMLRARDADKCDDLGSATVKRASRCRGSKHCAHLEPHVVWGLFQGEHCLLGRDANHALEKEASAATRHMGPRTRNLTATAPQRRRFGTTHVRSHVSYAWQKFHCRRVRVQQCTAMLLKVTSHALHGSWNQSCTGRSSPVRRQSMLTAAPECHTHRSARC